jgi:hypothetical protein
MSKKNYYCPNLGPLRDCYMKDKLSKVVLHLNSPECTCHGGRVWTMDDQDKLRSKPDYKRKPGYQLGPQCNTGTVSVKRQRSRSPPSRGSGSKHRPIEF